MVLEVLPGAACGETRATLSPTPEMSATARPLQTAPISSSGACCQSGWASSLLQADVEPRTFPVELILCQELQDPSVGDQAAPPTSTTRSDQLGNVATVE